MQLERAFRDFIEVHEIDKLKRNTFLLLRLKRLSGFLMPARIVQAVLLLWCTRL